MRVDFNLVREGGPKSQIAIEHSKLADADEVAKMKTYWQGALDKFAKMIEV